jgi:hypothetical protein
MGKQYLRDAEYDEPDETPSEMPHGWYIGIAVIYGSVLLAAFAFGWVCGATS